MNGGTGAPAYPTVRGALKAYTLTHGANGLQVGDHDDVFGAIAAALELPAVRVFETGGDRYEAEREQWASAVWQQAFNRLPTEQALLSLLTGRTEEP